jgi:hypothetical protein
MHPRCFISQVSFKFNPMTYEHFRELTPPAIGADAMSICTIIQEMNELHEICGFSKSC